MKNGDLRKCLLEMMKNGDSTKDEQEFAMLLRVLPHHEHA